MNRRASIFERVTDFENLHAAAWEVFRGKRDRLHAARLFHRLERELLVLQRELRDRSYAPGPYRTFYILEPKKRLISAAPLRDRIVHHALVRVIEPIFERRFIHHSYACRRGKGNHRCLEQFVQWARAKRFVLVMDVEKFFPSADHAVLKEVLRRTLRDPGVLWLIDTIIDGGGSDEAPLRFFPGDELFTPASRPRGLPIGNLTSQFLANVLLDVVDHAVKERLRARRYLRYVDDLAIFHDSRAFLVEMREAVREELLGLRLRLNERKSRLRRVREGVRFLGFVVTPDRLRLDRDAVRRSRRRVRALQEGFRDGALRFADVRRSLDAFSAHARHGTTHRLRADIFRRSPFIRGPRDPGP